VYTLIGSGDQYNEFSVIYDAASATAALWINGTKRVDDFGGHDRAGTPRVFFGTGDGGVLGHWNEVTFAIIPEPRAFALAVGLGAGFAVIGLRRRIKLVKPAALRGEGLGQRTEKQKKFLNSNKHLAD